MLNDIRQRITDEELTGTHADRYGERIIPKLAETLTEHYGKGFDRRSLYHYVQFYQTYPEIVDSLRPQSLDEEESGKVDSLNGRNVWENERKVVPNKELKSMVEFYKIASKDSILREFGPEL